MKRFGQFIAVWLTALLISSAVSHGVVRWFKIKANAEQYTVFGPKEQKPVAIMYGTSPAYDGVDWSQVSDFLGGGIGSWGIAGSSASEWEMMQLRGPEAPRAFIVVSPVDLSDYFLCDFRAQIVPLSKTVGELKECGADWSFCRRMLSQYPLTFIRQLFPTAGRSDGVMVGVRHMLQVMTGHVTSLDESGLAKLHVNGANTVTNRVTEWDQAHLERRLELLRSSFENKQWFDGPKKHALLRMVRNAAAHGKVTLVVMPMSPIYQKEFLTPQAKRDFERALAEAQAEANTPMVRLDALAQLRNNDVFWDLIHLNMAGQKIATAELLSELKTPQFSVK